MSTYIHPWNVLPLHLYLVIAICTRVVTNLHDIHRTCNNCNDKGSTYTNKLYHSMSCNAHSVDVGVASLVV